MKPPSPVILIADDDPMLRDSLAIRFAQSGFEVVTASDTQAAEDIVEHRRVDAAILDVKMARASRIGQHIRQAGRAIPVFIMAGADESPISGQLAAADDAHFITKPFDAKALVLMVDDVLRTA